ncbi:carbohydrate ABC transporter substrate-binding protein [Micromonospora sp. D93]|uniref:ABC transporter substrate-binding protein n=1 Tax=Micromonospora sp. D93 TaxID=2824886 RepID=UPI001B37B510|nr:ABC transporter substrate-binding protein [Micromonospora sp. D93]MBQ1017536.1 carbohydrate ABC transporter substrate-binding protein [Micromonospora sp. D93]
MTNNEAGEEIAMKRLMMRASALVVVGALAAGCSGNGDGGADGSDAKSISVMASQDWVRDPELDLAKKFETETGIKVDYQIIPSDQYSNVLSTKLNSGDAADIFMNQSGKFDIVSQLQIQKKGVDLTDQEWVSRMDPGAKDQASVDGKVYGQTIWDVSDSWAYTYNKKIFARLGLKPPTTFNEFMNVNAALKKAGVTPIYEPVKDGWHAQLNFFDVSAVYNKSNPNLVADLNANKTKLADQPIFKEMIQQMKQVYDAGYWGDNALSNEFANTAAEMASGKYAMTVNSMGRIPDIIAAGKGLAEDDFGIFPVPYLDNQVIASAPAGPTKFIYAKSKKIDAAKKYLEFLAKPENLQFMIDKEPSFNALSFTGLKTTYPPAMAQAIKDFRTDDTVAYQNVVIYLNPQWTDFGKDLTSYLLGDMPADEVIANIDERRADQAKAAKDSAW